MAEPPSSRTPCLQDIYKLLPEVKEEEVLNVYLFGSRVWGTADQTSDWDFVAIISDKSQYTGSEILEDTELNLNIDVFTEKVFTDWLSTNAPQAIVMTLLPAEFKWKEEKSFADFAIDKARLQRSGLSKACSCFNRAKYYFKYIEMAAEKSAETSNPKYAELAGLSTNQILRRGKKMISHCFRYFDFVDQLLTDGKISNFHAGLEYYEDRWRPSFLKRMDELKARSFQDSATLTMPEAYKTFYKLATEPQAHKAFQIALEKELFVLIKARITGDSLDELETDFEAYFPDHTALVQQLIKEHLELVQFIQSKFDTIAMAITKAKGVEPPDLILLPKQFTTGEDGRKFYSLAKESGAIQRVLMWMSKRAKSARAYLAEYNVPDYLSLINKLRASEL